MSLKKIDEGEKCWEKRGKGEGRGGEGWEQGYLASTVRNCGFCLQTELKHSLLEGTEEVGGSIRLEK